MWALLRNAHLPESMINQLFFALRLRREKQRDRSLQIQNWKLSKCALLSASKDAHLQQVPELSPKTTCIDTPERPCFISSEIIRTLLSVCETSFWRSAYPTHEQLLLRPNAFVEV
jgi:hypothetical protein